MLAALLGDQVRVWPPWSAIQWCGCFRPAAGLAGRATVMADLFKNLSTGSGEL